MAVEMATATSYDVRVVRPDKVTRMFSVLTIQEDADRYSALCRELGIASDGSTAAEAAVNVKHAVEEALAVAAEQGVSAGKEADDAAILDFLQNHHGPDPVAGYLFSI